MTSRYADAGALLRERSDQDLAVEYGGRRPGPGPGAITELGMTAYPRHPVR